MKREGVIKIISQIVRRYFPEVEAILYGSQARGDARPDSDIDLLFLVPDSAPSLFDYEWRINDKLLDVQINHRVSIQPVILKRKDWNRRTSLFHTNVLREGHRI